MTFPEFDQLVEKYFDKIRSLRDTKGKEYANNDTDRLANFKEIGAELGIPAIAVLNVYSLKHTRAISNYCRTGTSKSNETIESRILDRITYDFLLLGLIEDLKKEETFSATAIVQIKPEYCEPHGVLFCQVCNYMCPVCYHKKGTKGDCLCSCHPTS